MSLDRRLDRLEGILSPQAPPEWTTWEQDRLNADVFRCRQTGETARWDDLAGRPRTTILEYIDTDRIMHLPGGVTRRLGVGRDEESDAAGLN